MNDRERLYAIQTLAQQLYEESEPGATAWAQRGRSVREAWIAAARRIIDDACGQQEHPDSGK